ncbi:MAG: type II toxin-antitoxin system ParD family antitoxin [Hyphomicrobiales bacterium]|nr:type II toxin-antitoxin system ParD family antitoxin [Hyphomicrobiales bacterium]MCY4032848.1 type II toxin-antitoxin system ParD family antitoxin [Hyphomicrobiales bacterium]MCY4038119.1 type II toxin-antitoxin system ParD family antitoxin [Hyphomicrobiales bacterium]
MATTQRTITVTEQQNEWIDAQVVSGHFTNDSDYIRDLIRRDQDRYGEVEWIRNELLRGEQSGEPRAFDGDLFKKKMTAKYAGSSR